MIGPVAAGSAGPVPTPMREVLFGTIGLVGSKPALELKTVRNILRK